MSEGGAPAQAGVLRPDLPDAMQKAGVDKQSALYRAVVRIQSRYRGYVIRKVCHQRALPHCVLCRWRAHNGLWSIGMKHSNKALKRYGGMFKV